MKVVINRCFGGFGVSAEAMLLLIERKAKGVQTSPLKEWKNKGKTVPFKRGFKTFSRLFRHYVLVKGDKVYTFSSYSKDRSDPVLVGVVEELGEEANGECSELKVVDVPDDIMWEITDYDGMERVEEVRRSWA